MVKILVCGSRDWTDRAPIERELSKYPAGTIVVHGAAPGADTMAGEIARRLGFEVEAFPADWDQHGKAAGPIRNRRMLKEAKPDLVLAFSNMPLTPGTRNMLEQASAAGVPSQIFQPTRDVTRRRPGQLAARGGCYPPCGSGGA